VRLRVAQSLAGIYFGGIQEGKPVGRGKMVAVHEQILDNGMYLSAVWVDGQPTEDLLVIKQSGLVFKGSHSDKSKLAGCIYNAKSSLNCSKLKSHDLTGEEFFHDGSKYEGRFDHLSRPR